MKMTFEELKEFVKMVPPDTIFVVEFTQEEGEKDDKEDED